ncbi:hypothetical protein B0H13DRAFT_1449290, partial [Mycena leptocephala]
ISQLRTGPSPLNHNRHKADFIPSACDACSAASETRAHFLLECPAWELHRQPLYSACKSINIFGPLTVSPLLTEPKLLRTFAKFIEATGRF